MFSKCKDEKDAKDLFRKLAMRLHPDYGGSNEMMILLKNCYEVSVEYLNGKKDKEKPNTETNNFYEKTYEDVKKGDPRLKIIIEMLEYSDINKKFKVDFTCSVVDYLKEKGYVTSNQYNTLVNIYYCFEMDKKQC